jgi:hypothetical protein
MSFVVNVSFWSIFPAENTVCVLSRIAEYPVLGYCSVGYSFNQVRDEQISGPDTTVGVGVRIGERAASATDAANPADATN